MERDAGKPARKSDPLRAETVSTGNTSVVKQIAGAPVPWAASVHALALEAQRKLAVALPRSKSCGESPHQSTASITDQAADQRDALDEPVQALVSDWYGSGAFSWGAVPATPTNHSAPWLDSQWAYPLELLARVRCGWPKDLDQAPAAVKSLWRHSFAVGLVSELLVRLCDAGEASDAFLAGSLHDIGLLALQAVVPERFAEVMDDVDSLTPTCRSERRLLGWDHQRFGAELLRLWGLPPVARDAARYHHQPLQLPPGRAHARVVRCVAMANYLCSRAGCASLGVHNVAPPPDDVFAQLSIDAGVLRLLWSALPERLALAEQLL